MKQPYLFFDAGGTVVFLSATIFRQEIERLSLAFDLDNFDRCLRSVNFKLDQYRRKGLRWQDHFQNKHFFRLILDELGIPPQDAEAIKDAIVAINTKRNIWSATFDWVPETLAKLKKMGYGMSIISNTDGRISRATRGRGNRPFLRPDLRLQAARFRQTGSRDLYP